MEKKTYFLSDQILRSPKNINKTKKKQHPIFFVQFFCPKMVVVLLKTNNMWPLQKIDNKIKRKKQEQHVVSQPRIKADARKEHLAELKRQSSEQQAEPFRRWARRQKWLRWLV